MKHFWIAFFLSLFRDADLNVYNLITNQTELWYPTTRELWNSYIQRRRGNLYGNHPQRFKNALQTGDVMAITQTYQTVLKEVQYPGTHINQQARDIALLAGDIVSSYTLQDAEALKQAHQEIQQSPYKNLIRSRQRDRTKHCRPIRYACTKR